MLQLLLPFCLAKLVYGWILAKTISKELRANVFLSSAVQYLIIIQSDEIVTRFRLNGYYPIPVSFSEFRKEPLKNREACFVKLLPGVDFLLSIIRLSHSE
jgi:hypothetical protein